MKIIQEIAQTIRDSDQILLVCHSGADGDAYGSLLAMNCVLAELGKKTALYIESGMPKNFAFYPELVYTEPATLPFEPKLIIFLDCAELKRVGDIFADYYLKHKKINSICIDHHLSEKVFAKQNWIDSSMAATGQMCAYLAAELGISYAPPLSNYLYMAISGDTGSFSYSNTSPELLRLVADFCDQGLKISEVRDLIDKQSSLERFQLWALCLSRVKVAAQGKIIYSYVSQKEMQDFNTSGEDLEGFVEHLRSLQGSAISMMFREDKANQCKVSLRSQGEISVQKVAMLFGGGGHKNASGLTIKADAPSAAKTVVQAAEEYLHSL